MNSVFIAGIVFACAFFGAMLGMFLQKVLPESHLRAESRDTIRLSTGLIATMAALVLGLLVGAAKSSFDAQSSGFRQLATNVILLDRSLAHYGPEAQPSRVALKQLVKSTIDCLWPSDASLKSNLTDSHIDGSSFFDAIRTLAPQDDPQRAAQGQALQAANDLSRIRWTLSQQEETLPLPFLSVLALWLLVLFASFGLFAPKNPTVVAALFLGALSVSAAVFLIVDLDQPFEGLLQVSSAPLQNALTLLEQ